DAGPGVRVRPVVRLQRPLRGQAGRQRGRRLREGEEERVTLGEHLHATVGGEGTPQQPAVLLQHRPVAGTEQLGEPGRTFDVGEQEGHQAARRLRTYGHDTPAPWKSPAVAPGRGHVPTSAAKPGVDRWITSPRRNPRKGPRALSAGVT